MLESIIDRRLRGLCAWLAALLAVLPFLFLSSGCASGGLGDDPISDPVEGFEGVPISVSFDPMNPIPDYKYDYGATGDRLLIDISDHLDAGLDPGVKATVKLDPKTISMLKYEIDYHEFNPDTLGVPGIFTIIHSGPSFVYADANVTEFAFEIPINKKLKSPFSVTVYVIKESKYAVGTFDIQP